MKNKITGLLFALRIDLKKKKCTTCDSSSWAVPISPTSVMSRRIVTVVCNGCFAKKDFSLVCDNELAETDSLYKCEEEPKVDKRKKNERANAKRTDRNRVSV